MEDILEGRDKCVSLRDGICTLCDTIKGSRKVNPELFNKNPIKFLFGEEPSLEQTNHFWDVLQKNCSINKPETLAQEAPAFYVAEADYDKLTHDYDIVQKNIKLYTAQKKIKNNNASDFVRAIYYVAMSPRGVDFSTKVDPEEFLKGKIAQHLSTEKCSIIMFHRTIELPMAISLLLSDLSIANEESFILVADFFDRRPQVCLDGAVEAAHNLLQEPTRSREKTSPINKSRRSQNSDSNNSRNSHSKKSTTNSRNSHTSRNSNNSRNSHSKKSTINSRNSNNSRNSHSKKTTTNSRNSHTNSRGGRKKNLAKPRNRGKNTRSHIY